MLRRVVFEVLAVAILAPLLKWLGKGLLKLVENAITGWIDDTIAKTFEIGAPSIAGVLAFAVQWGLPVATAVGVIFLYHVVHRRWFLAPPMQGGQIRGAPDAPLPVASIPTVGVDPAYVAALEAHTAELQQTRLATEREEWRAKIAKQLVRTSNAADKVDPQIDRIRRDIGALKEGLLSHGSFEHERAQLGERYQRIRSSDHVIWLEDKIRRLREDFLNRCGIAISVNKRYDTAEEFRTNRAEIDQFGNDLDAAIVRWMENNR